MPQLDFVDHAEIKREVLAHPVFSGGSLKFVRSFSAEHSRLLEYTLKSNSGIRSIVIKHQVSVPDAARATTQEFENLNKLYRILGSHFARSVPEPLAALPERGILITSKVPGTPFAITLKKYGNRLCGSFCSSFVGEKARMVGIWLKNFQDATRDEPLAFAKGLFLAEIERRLSRLQAKGFEPDLAPEILKRVAFQAAALDGQLVPTAARHGDFIAQNILIDHDAVGVVDFESFTEKQAVYDDLGMFLGYLLVLGTSLPYSRLCLDAVGHGFLEGFRKDNTIDQSFLNIYILKGMIRIITDGPSPKNKWGRLGVVGKLTKALECVASRSI